MLNMNAYILTGGLSRRFGSDKAVCTINGTTFLEKIFKTLQSDFTHVLSVGKKPYSKKIEFLQDFSDYQAAMVGIITALRHTSSQWNFIISVDMPYITPNVICALQKEIISLDDGDVVVPSVNGQIFPLFGFYHQNSLIYFEKAYSLKKYALMNVITSLSSTVINLSHYDIELTNINTRDQLIIK
jgi:molybdopterin-guanine dinucleotide biosynthesis protein A